MLLRSVYNFSNRHFFGQFSHTRLQNFGQNQNLVKIKVWSKSKSKSKGSIHSGAGSGRQNFEICAPGANFKILRLSRGFAEFLWVGYSWYSEVYTIFQIVIFWKIVLRSVYNFSNRHFLENGTRKCIQFFKSSFLGKWYPEVYTIFQIVIFWKMVLGSVYYFSNRQDFEGR